MSSKHVLSYNDFEVAKHAAYLPSGLEPLCITKEAESAEYGALMFNLNEHKIKFRVGKVTPTKVGHFVTVWKREDGVTKPHDVSDPFDFFMISVRDHEGFGQFIFPKAVLLKHNIISSDATKGKRGIRVYPPWIETVSTQAKKTQLWQCQYFIKMDEHTPMAYPNLVQAFVS